MPTVAEYSEFFQSYNPSGGGKEEWNMECQAVVHRMAAWAAGVYQLTVYPTARAARLASGTLTLSMADIPYGAVGYWQWDPDDHTGVWTPDGWVMGSRHISTAFGGVSRNVGTVDHATFQARAGLKFLGWSKANGRNVVPVEPDVIPGFRRIVGASGVSKRTVPTTVGNTPTGEIEAGDYGDFDGFIRGQDPYGFGNNLWFRGKYSGAYFYSGAFLDSGTHDLADLGTFGGSTEPTEPTVPNNPDNPGTAPYVFIPDLDVVDRVSPAARTNWEPSNFPALPTSVVIHQWDDPARNPTLEGVLKEVHTPQPEADAMAPHFVVDDEGNIIQMVSLKDRAYHAGKGGNDMVGIEVEPHFGEATTAGVVRLLRALRARNGGVPLTEKLHREVSATACGKDVAPRLEAIRAAVRLDPPKPPPVIPPWVALIAAGVVFLIGAIAAALGH